MARNDTLQTTTCPECHGEATTLGCCRCERCDGNGYIYSKPYWKCKCGAVAWPLTGDTTCKCGEIYVQDWSLVMPGEGD